MLADMVASGDLPSVEERLPINPIVIKPEEAVGKYGGALRKTVSGQRAMGEMGWWVDEPLTLHNPKGVIVHQRGRRLGLEATTIPNSPSCCARASSGVTANPSPPTTSCSGGRTLSSTRI